MRGTGNNDRAARLQSVRGNAVQPTAAPAS